MKCLARLDYCGIRCCTGVSVISWYSILFSYNRFARGHTEEIRAREIVKSHDDSLEARIFEFVCLRVEFLSVYALSPDATSWYT